MLPVITTNILARLQFIIYWIFVYMNRGGRVGEEPYFIFCGKMSFVINWLELKNCVLLYKIIKGRWLKYQCILLLKMNRGIHSFDIKVFFPLSKNIQSFFINLYLFCLKFFPYAFLRKKRITLGRGEGGDFYHRKKKYVVKLKESFFSK